jgi:hypothetical protein
MWLCVRLGLRKLSVAVILAMCSVAFAVEASFCKHKLDKQNKDEMGDAQNAYVG